MRRKTPQPASITAGLCFMRLKDYFDDYLQYLQECGASSITVKKHKLYILGSLSHSVHNKKISDLRLTDRASIIQAGQRHGKYGPQESIIKFRCLLKFLQDSGMTLPFDWRDIEVPRVSPKEVVSLTENEIKKILSSISVSDLIGLRMRALLEILFDTGLRISEALSLNRDDIDWNRKEAKVLNSKNNKWGMVYLTSRSILWLKKYLRARRDDCPPVFATVNGDRLTAVTVRHYFKKYITSLGLKKHISAHIYRRTFVTVLLRNKVDIKTVQKLARHESERTTLRYYAAIDNEYAKREHWRVMSR